MHDDSPHTAENPLLEITLKEIFERCSVPLDPEEGINESATVSDLLHSRHIFNSVRASIPGLPGFLLTMCRESIRDYLSKHSDRIVSPLEAILEQFRLFNTVHPSITVPLLEELTVRCIRKENIPAESRISNIQLPLHILREFVQLEPSLAQHFRHVQIAIQELVLKVINVQRKKLPKPYLFQSNNVILGLVAAVGINNDHLQFVHSAVDEMEEEITSWINNGNSISSKPEYALAVYPLKHLLENSLDVTFFKDATGA